MSAFPRHPSAVEIGHECVILGGGATMNATYFSATEFPAAVGEHYRQALGEAGLEKGGDDDWLWRVPAEKPLDILHVLPLGAAGPHARFASKAPADAKTVIIVAHRSG